MARKLNRYIQRMKDEHTVKAALVREWLAKDRELCEKSYDDLCGIVPRSSRRRGTTPWARRGSALRATWHARGTGCPSMV